MYCLSWPFLSPRHSNSFPMIWTLGTCTPSFSLKWTVGCSSIKSLHSFWYHLKIWQSYVNNWTFCRFYVISLFIHGILAGFSAWQTLQISKYDTDLQFLTEYKSLAWPAASAYFLCLTVCVVSSLDILETAITYSKADLLMGMFKNPVHTLTGGLNKNIFPGSGLSIFC